MSSYMKENKTGYRPPFRALFWPTDRRYCFPPHGFTAVYLRPSIASSYCVFVRDFPILFSLALRVISKLTAGNPTAQVTILVILFLSLIISTLINNMQCGSEGNQLCYFRQCARELVVLGKL